MLIEFKVTNYRSIRETQTLSMVRGKGKELEEKNTFSSGLKGLPDLLRSAVIYGPNAAGKSNILKAMAFMRSFVLSSQSLQAGQSINGAIPFLLSSVSSKEPSRFEVIFIKDKVRYKYGFAVDKVRVTEEWLTAYPKGRPQHWFKRKYQIETDKYSWDIGTSFSDPHKQREVWKNSTRPNGLFLSTAIQLNNIQLVPIDVWFEKILQNVPPGAGINAVFSKECCTSDDGKERIMKFLKEADLNISGIEVTKEQEDTQGVSLDGVDSAVKKVYAKLQETIRQSITNLPGEIKSQIPVSREVRFLHDAIDSNEVIPFDFSYESDGTRKLFAFAGPLLDVFEKGMILVVDELNNSLHPLLLHYIIGLFHDPEVNKKNAQLIFTTHDTTSLDPDIFRRDQVWFVEKNKNSASVLYSLSDFHARKNEDFGKWYLQGRYGALPFIGEFKF